MAHHPWLPLAFRALWAPFLLGMGASSTSVADTSSTTGAAWPGFRGPRVDGIAPATSVFPADERFGLEIAWKRKIGSGYSGVSIAGGRVVTMYADGASDVVASFDEATGKPQWKFDIEETYIGHDGSHTGPLSTPLIAGGRVFALSARGRLVGLEAATGKLVWSVDLVAEHKAVKPHYGFTTSPLLMDGVLIVQMGADRTVKADEPADPKEEVTKDLAAVAGFDPANGKLLWDGGEDAIAFQSPIPYAIGNQDIVLSAGQKKLIGLHAKTGEVLWQYEHGGGGTRGVASLVPVPAGRNRLFLAHKDDGSTAIEWTRKDGEVSFESIWEEGTIRNSYNVPVYHDGHVYAYSSRFLTCVDAKTGKAKWRSRKPGDGFLSLVDGHLVIVTKKGSVHIARASPTGYEELAGREVFADLSWSNPAFANGHIYVRSLGELARIDIRRAAAPTNVAKLDQGLAHTRLGRFLEEIERASDKNAAVDRFMASVKRFPMIERPNRVHFLYRGPGEDLAVAGDIFGARQEQAMTRVAGTDLFYYSTALEPDARVNYMFLRDYEGMLDPKNDRTTTTTVYTDEMEMSFSGAEFEMSWFSMPDWREPAHLSPPTGRSLGSMEIHELESKQLGGAYTIDVYLPAHYAAGTERLPVAYVHDGKTALTRGRLKRSLDNLIGRSIQPVIVVFITAQARGKSTEYTTMWAEELVPFIDTTYRTIASKEARAHIGHGFGGYNALLCALGYPEVASKVAIQSSFIFDSMQKAIDALVTTADEKPLDLFLEWGKYDLRNPHEAWDLADTNRSLAQSFQEKGYKTTGGEVHDGTGWSSWRNRTDVVFETLFPLKAHDG